MEEQNVNAQGGDLSNFREAFSNYQKKQAKTPRTSKEDKLAKYFTPRKAKETFRILPHKNKFYTEAFFHVIPITGAGGKKTHTKVYCPAHNDPKVQKVVNGVPQLDGNGNPLMIPAPCPLCDKAKKLLSTQNPSLKNRKKEDLSAQELVVWENNRKIFIEAGKMEAKKFYIIRGIDKGAEKDGVKFWRFKHNYQNKGTLDTLFPILDDFISQNGVSYADPVNGSDLSISTVESIMPATGQPYRSITSISTRNKSPLHTDPIIVRQWLEDKTTWRDIFKAKTAPGITPLQYLEMAAAGQNPYWEDSDASNKHWVFPGRPDLETAANTRTRNLDSDDNSDIEMASDLEEGYDKTRVTISNVTAQNVGTYPTEYNDITAKTNVSAPVVEEEHDDLASNDVDESTDDYTDLPF